MNKIIEITESDIGRKAVYVPYEGCDPMIHEEGVITSFKETSTGQINVFVRYGSDVNSKATNLESLYFLGSK